MNYSQKDYAHLSLRSWVNVVIGKMTAIDRRRKHICINGQTILPYDHLILCTGEQYYFIAPLQLRIYNPYSRQEIKPHSSRPLFGKFNFKMPQSLLLLLFKFSSVYIDAPPSNMFVINNEYEAEHLLIYIENNNLLSSNGLILIFFNFKNFNLNSFLEILRKHYYLWNGLECFVHLADIACRWC